MKPTNSPTQDQPNPTKIRFIKVAFWPLFPTANNFSWVGIDFIQETDHKKPNPTKCSVNTQLSQVHRVHRKAARVGAFAKRRQTKPSHVLDQDTSQSFLEGQVPTSCTPGMVPAQTRSTNVREPGDSLVARSAKLSPPDINS